jgi:23S rRNA pseudouridine2605 synthase
VTDAFPEEERLARFLARAGAASRRRAEDLIREGRVTLNGRTVLEPGARVNPARDAVRLDGRRVVPSQRVYILLNKPRAVLCTMEDPRGRPCVGDLLAGMKGRPCPVGRLDFDAEGLLLCTNDGELAHQVIHPRHHVKRVYHVKVRGVPGKSVIDQLRTGVFLDGKKTAPAGVSLMKKGEKNCWIRMALHEGRNRQVKRMLERFGLPVLKLKRVALGPLTLEGMPAGAYRKLRPEEVQELQRCLGGLDKENGRL